MSIWTIKPTVEGLNEMCQQTMVTHLGIEITDIGDGFIKARMPVDHRTQQPDQLLHGGASVALGETLGSIAANLCIDRKNKICVGLEINANHVRSARKGFVYGESKPIHLGGSTQIWETRIVDEEDKLICISRMTMAVLTKNKV